ncbi:LysR substrate-binding domain-containing protein [Pseudotabrizicola sp. L79]|uniref:LysR substrate-binding domain-containing protein n=1 Tax=Pseudotabrizicola sp. L79 TaxID=3118402 RepID=UPI002F9445F8
MVRYTLKQCAYFRTVAESGGIAQAARILNISQPSISQAIDKLEAVTGLVLFARHHARGLKLTASGRMFLQHVTRLLDQADQLVREAEAIATEASGELRLGVFWTLSPFYTADLIRSFRAEAPGVLIRHQERSLTDLAEDLRKGLIECAITYDRGAVMAGLECHELLCLRPSVVLAADHPLARKTAIQSADLRGMAYVMLDGPGSRGYFEEVLAELKLTPEIVFTSSSLEAVRSAVAADLGFTLLVVRPPSDLTYDGRRVKVLPILDDVRPLRVVLAARQSVAQGPVARRFAQFAGRYFEQIRASLPKA